MELNVGKELTALKRMTPAELRIKYAEVFGEASRSGHKEWLVKRITWRLQANAEGGLSERAKRRATELANDGDLRMQAPRTANRTLPMVATPVCRVLPERQDGRLPIPGTVITRLYKGQMLNVSVLPEGFEHEGEIYKSLSAVAKKITGSHCNGYLFFRLNKQGVGR